MRHASLARGVKKQFPARGNCDRLSTGIRVERSMVDTYRTSKVLADHVVIVTGYLSEKIGPEAAIVCVMEHLQIVLQDALEGGNPADMALVLGPDGSEA